MAKKKGLFKDPNGNFIITIPDDWAFNNDEPTIKKGLYQFEVSEDCVFQISCRPVNERILKIINGNKIIKHDFNLPNISYLEKCKFEKDLHMYTWMCYIEDFLMLGTYYYNPDVKQKIEIGLDLMNIRLSLQNLHFISEDNKSNINIKQQVDKDYSDIESWRDKPEKFLDSLGEKKDKLPVERLSPVNIDTVKLYALLKTKISSQPNGFYDLLRVGLPLDNMIWWDYVLECEKGFIQIWRTPYILEAHYRFEGDFDLLAFLNNNIEKYRDEILKTIQRFDEHTLYINHYKSYDECVNTLWEQIKKIDLTVPESVKEHISENSEYVQQYSKSLAKFSENSIRYHALSKSLVLNAAFKIESFLNLLIRVGCKYELRAYPEVLNKFLRQDFTHRVKNMKFYSMILIDNLDLSDSIFRETKELMILRNKYVHFDEDSQYNRLGEIFYDNDYPLHPTEESRPAIQSIKQMYHRPDLETVKKVKQTSENFINHLIDLIKPEVKDDLIFLMNQNPIGYNEASGVYSSVFNPTKIDFFASTEVKNDEEE